MSITNFALDFLDRIGLYYLPENHCLPAYANGTGKQPVKKPENSRKIQPENSRKITAGFRAVPEEENHVVVSVWESTSARATALTETEIHQLTQAGLSVKVAEVVKLEKAGNGLSTRQIVAKHHAPGATDGFSKGNIDKVAKIVCPSR
jgi:hypothetical protein